MGAGTHDTLQLGDQLDLAEILHDYSLKPDQFWNHLKRLLEQAFSNKPLIVSCKLLGVVSLSREYIQGYLQVSN